MAGTVQWQNESDHSTTTSRRSHPSESERSYETAPTERSTRPSVPRNETCLGRVESQKENYFGSAEDLRSQRSLTARCSVDTYASTSEEELAEPVEHASQYHIPPYVTRPPPADAIPTTPRDFADLFPTSKRISIRHDNSTIDGNMNLRVDTQLEGHDHKKQYHTLFHLRMHDLRTREFSLRRYCRESGREVCHMMRKYQPPPAEKRPVLQRASTALAHLRHKPDSRPATSNGLKRSDSGYESVHQLKAELADNSGSRPKSTGYAKGRALIPTNTIKLEFSNYAHLDVKRRGAHAGKRYAFEYWGQDYQWKRIISRESGQETITYYLYRSDNDQESLAHISPFILSPDQQDEEDARGTWVPPCYMRITDENILKSTTDICDVVVASGLVALVDDCIKRRFHAKQQTVQLSLPLMRNKMQIDYIGPKRLIDEVFNRTTRGAPQSRHSPASR